MGRFTTPLKSSGTTISHESGNKVASLPFFLILVCFLFPFLEISCHGQRMMSLTGYQVAFGAKVQQPFSFDGPAKTQNIDGNSVVALTLVCAVAAGVLCLVNNTGGAIAGGIGLILLFAAKLQIDSDALSKGQGLISVVYGGGFYSTLLLIIIGSALCFYKLMGRR